MIQYPVVTAEVEDELKRFGRRITHVSALRDGSGNFICKTEQVVAPTPRQWVVEAHGLHAPGKEQGAIMFGPVRQSIHVVRELKPLTLKTINQWLTDIGVFSGDAAKHIALSLSSFGIEVEE